MALVACGDSTGEGGSGSTIATTYKGTQCDECDRTACGSERSACTATASCQAYLTCLLDCPLDANKDADAACEASCANGDTSDELAAFRTCRTAGPGTTCDLCPREVEGGAGGEGGGTPLCTSPDFLAQECGDDSEPDACLQCMFESCCDSVDALFNNPGPSVDLKDCWLACNDSACESDCFEMYPTGVQDFGEYQACLNTRCGQPDGPCQVSNSCSQCLYEECECEYASCLSSPDCFLANHCFDECDDSDCVNACVDAISGKDPEFTQYVTCTAQRCGSQCGSG